MATATQIEQAEELKTQAVHSLCRAYEELCDAQNQITNVEGKGSADIYDAIADAYQEVAKLRGRLLGMNPTGIFE